MAKEYLVVPEAGEESLFTSLQSLGFRFGNPASGEISGWTQEGRQVFRDIESGLEAFRMGTGIQLWRGAGSDLYIARDFEEETIRVWFDGWTTTETAEIMEGLRRRGIVFEIAYD